MRHNGATLYELIACVDVLGLDGLRAVIAGREIEPVKYGETTVGQIEAVRNRLGPVWERLLADEVEFVFQEPTKAIVKPKPQLAVDTDGRFIFRGIKQVVPANWSYGFDRSIQPSYAEVLERLEYAFARKIGISAVDFEKRAEVKKAEITNNPLFANLFKGQYARPFANALPQMEIPKEGGLGKLLAQNVVPAAKRGYLRKYTERQFNDYRGDTLVGLGQTESFPGSRQERLIAALAEGPQVLWVFLNCLQGGSINAARELIQTLPEEFILGGTLVNAPVIAAYPGIAAVGAKNPLYLCAADVFQPARSLFLYPRADGVHFGYWSALGRCYGYSSASVAVLA